MFRNFIVRILQTSVFTDTGEKCLLFQQMLMGYFDPTNLKFSTSDLQEMQFHVAPNNIYLQRNHDVWKKKCQCIFSMSKLKYV